MDFGFWILDSVVDGVTPHQSEGSNVFPYLMSRPVFTESLKSSSQQASGKSAKGKQQSFGWKQDDDSKWFKHGGEEESDRERSNKGQSSYQNGSHKKSLGHDNRDFKEKWKKGSESGEHENEKLVEEYNKNKGRMYEKKWSWEKERGSGHGWENAGHNDQNHSKGLFNQEYNSELKSNEGKETYAGGKKKSHAETDSWAGKHIDKGLRSEDKDQRGKDSLFFDKDSTASTRMSVL